MDKGWCASLNRTSIEKLRVEETICCLESIMCLGYIYRQGRDAQFGSLSEGGHWLNTEHHREAYNMLKLISFTNG